MKDEAYVKEILQKFGETIDCYSEELKAKKYKRELAVLLDYNRNDPGYKSVLQQTQNIYSCFESEEVSKMSAGVNSDYSTDHTHLRKMPSPNTKPPTTILEEGLQIQPSVFCEHDELRKDTGRIIFGLDKDSRPGRVNGVLGDPRLGKTTRGISGI